MKLEICRPPVNPKPTKIKHEKDMTLLIASRTIGTLTVGSINVLNG